ncbi:MAG: lamin tail domain-containing protein [Anaerolineaceae bacterium]|jgi:hypothetical protein
MKKWLPFLLLNVILSAAAMLIVLLIWQSRHPLAFQTPVPPASGAQTVSASPAAPDSKNQSIEIQNVIGAGDLNLEAVTLKNAGKSAVDLSGWSLKSENGSVFTFPSFTVFPGGAFQVFSRSGVNTSLELYWGSPVSLWTSGAKVTLTNPFGTTKQEFKIP